ncbi:MAG: serine/threonine protein kinase [Planctomycetota bacterium]|nr:MAG: serine/threonine protein kinase [Planctomycetota bacterium]
MAGPARGHARRSRRLGGGPRGRRPRRAQPTPPRAHPAPDRRRSSGRPQPGHPFRARDGRGASRGSRRGRARRGGRPRRSARLGRDRGACPGRDVSGDRFRVLRVLGKGATGEVLEADDRMLGRRVALKVLRRATERARQRFEAEGRALARLRHPAIVRVHEVTSLGEAPCLVMELVEGESLEARIAREGPLAAHEVLAVGRAVASALEAAHRAGLVHRDVKPSNVLLADDGRVLLADFGVARDRGADVERLTRTGEWVGTPAFMAPEQLRSGLDVGAPADVYALGATLYCAATGVPPLQRQNLPELIGAVLSALPPPPSSLRAEVGGGFDQVLLRCLAKEPAERYPTAAQLAADLERLERGEAVARSTSSVVLPLRRLLGGRLLYALACLAAVGMALGLALAYRPAPARSPAEPARRPAAAGGAGTGTDAPPPPGSPAADPVADAALVVLSHPGVQGAFFLGGDGARVLSWDGGGTVVLWELGPEGGRAVRRLALPAPLVALRPGPRGRYLAVAGRRGFDVLDLVDRKDPSDGGLPALFAVRGFAWISPERLALCGDFPGVRIALARRSWLPTDDVPLRGPVALLAASPDGEYLAAANALPEGEGYAVHLLGTGNRERIGGWVDFERPTALVFGPKSRAVYVGDAAGKLLRFTVRVPPALDPERFAALPRLGLQASSPREAITSLAVGGGRVWAASGTQLGFPRRDRRAGSVWVWDARSRVGLGRVLPNRRSRYAALDLSADGHRLLLASTNEGTVSVWETARLEAAARD